MNKVFCCVAVLACLLVQATALKVENISKKERNFLFDFGTADSPVKSGFIKATHVTKYNSGLGYGFIDPPSNSFHDADIEPQNDISQDGVRDIDKISFRTDIPEGEYDFFITIGNGDVGKSQASVKINGETLLESIVTPWYRLAFRTLRQKINVEKAGITVEVVPDSGIIGVQAIEIRPINSDIPIHFKTKLDADTSSVAEAARRIHRKLSGDPTNVTVINRLNLLEKYLLACYYYDIGWWSWAVEETGMSIFERFWYASDLLRQIIVDTESPLYFRAVFLLGKIHYWLYQEQHLAWNKIEANKFFKIVKRQYPSNHLVRMYLGEKIPHDFKINHPDISAPKWATKQREAMHLMLNVIHWWVDNKQTANGELGGKFGDDVEILRWWLPAIFGADDSTAKLGFLRLVEGVWNSGKLKRGFAVKIDDVEHAAEFITDTHPVMIMMDYGNPTYIERCLISMQNFRDVWTAVNKYGHRHFKSCYLSTDEIVDKPPYASDVAMNARATVAGLWAAWYNHNPTIVKLFSEWGTAWVEDALRTEKGKPVGLLPSAVRFDNDEIGGYSDNWYHPNLGWEYYKWERIGSISEMYNQLTGMSFITHDSTFLIPLDQTVKLLEETECSIKRAEIGSAAWAAHVLKGDVSYTLSNPKKFWLVIGRTKSLIQTDRYDGFLKQHGTPYLDYLFTGEKQYLIQGCEEIVNQLKFNFPLRTSEVKFTDRVDVNNADLLFGMYTGGIGEGREFPSAAVTWENTGKDIAVLVNKANTRQLQNFLYNFGDERRVILKLWRLASGKYSLQAGFDNNADDEIDFFEKQTNFVMKERGQKLSINIPARRLFIIRINQLEEYEPFDFTIPDVGLSESDIIFSKPIPISGEIINIRAKVHNLGSQIAKDILVEFYVDNQKVGQQKICFIEAPLDLIPRSKTVNIDWKAKQGKHRFKVCVKMDRNEITLVNNQAKKFIQVK